MGKSWTNVETWLGILFVFALLVGGLVAVGNDILLNPNSNLDNDSIDYIASLQGVNATQFQASSNPNTPNIISQYQKNITSIQTSATQSGNNTQGTSKDYSLEFFWAQDKSASFEAIIKTTFNIPSYILGTLFRLPVNNFSWILNILGWLMGLLILMSVIFFIRGIITQK
jgi:hypothetical protein